ncbi:hypothetical protein, partial [Prevotella pallens]|uniref:hypothetical protein n=1 Tax=Prevotella pallens TaxID=60133 RepID=UPI0023EFEF95
MANNPQTPNEHTEIPTKHTVKYPHTPTKCVANNPLGVGADSSCPYPDINKNVYFHNQICVSTLLNMCIQITEYV